MKKIFLFLFLFSFTLYADDFDTIDNSSVEEGYSIYENTILSSSPEQGPKINTQNTRKYTLIEILDFALKNNPQVKEAWLNIDSSKYSYYGGLSEFLPNFSASASVSHSKSKIHSKTEEDSFAYPSKTRNTSMPSISMSYLLFDFGGRTADILKFKYKLNAVKYDTNEFIQEFIYKVISSYYTLLSSLANETASIESELASLEAYKSATLRNKLGLVPLTDKLQAETLYNQMKLNRERVQNEVKINRANLNYLLNISPIIEINLEIPELKIDKNDFDTNVVDLIADALKNRPDLKSYYESKKAKKAELYSNTVDWLPKITLDGSYNRSTRHYKNNPDYTNKNYTIGLNASMTFFTGGRIYSNIAKTKTDLNIIKRQIDAKKKSIEIDVWTAYQNFITAKEIFLTSQVLVKSATETANTMLGRYKTGKASILDLLDAQSNLASAKYELISSQHNWFITRANLLKSIGDMSVETLSKIMNND